MNIYKDYIKRLLDVFFAFIILIIATPILLLVCIGIFVSNKSFNILFFQDRPGKNKVIFRVFKFKTMQDIYNQKMELMPDSVRITKIGKFLRTFSLDELPQLINILKGEMSLVGPRPLLPEYLPKYTDEQNRRHEVRPGITGWAQINGRNEATFKDRFKYDVWYVDNVSFLLDCKILMITVLKVFKSEGMLVQDPNTINDISN
jgi:undecaprenyl phosphate N,N'-diacetylbacillosamine 1-phosphate transferase